MPCIEWTGWRDRDGYGRTTRWQGVHRAAWEKANGPIPVGYLVMHDCDNPPCVNLDHLRLGTVADNNRDRANKGRSARNRNPKPGEQNGRAILNDAIVREIRELHAREGRKSRGRPRVGVTRKEIAMRFGVSIPAIDAVLSGGNWKGGDAQIRSFRRSASSGQGLA